MLARLKKRVGSGEGEGEIVMQEAHAAIKEFGEDGVLNVQQASHHGALANTSQSVALVAMHRRGLAIPFIEVCAVSGDESAGQCTMERGVIRGSGPDADSEGC